MRMISMIAVLSAMAMSGSAWAETQNAAAGQHRLAWVQKPTHKHHPHTQTWPQYRAYEDHAPAPMSGSWSFERPSGSDGGFVPGDANGG